MKQEITTKEAGAQARSLFQQVALGPDEAPRIQALQEAAAQLEARAQALEGKLVPRPVPGRYQAVMEEFERFVGSMGRLDRILGLLHRLQVVPC